MNAKFSLHFCIFRGSHNFSISILILLSDRNINLPQRNFFTILNYVVAVMT